MDNNKKQVSSSSTLKNFDQLFGPKDSSSASSSSNALFGSIFPPSSSVGGRDYSRTQDVAGKHFGITGGSNKNESVVEPNYYSSSIYYGGQEIYSPRSKATTATAAATPTTAQPHHLIFKKDKEDGDPNGTDPNSDPRGNWWQGSLYY
ncbi:hypothetical protein PIB30_079182 [Stylosanthes scabra]|uniref:Uncharacterized protein n=1 Tax=Stylosanthes scabra TaxID=79078 RepID=A0ABU6ZPT0_9FABA|nr:hypothetical protein [Stylosanthes scabra]